MENTKRCPYCGEEIKADATKCKHCGEWLNDEAVQEQSQKADNMGTVPTARQNAATTQSEMHEPSGTQAIKAGPLHHNSKKWLLAIVPIVVVLVGLVLYLFGAFGNESILKGSQSNNGSSTIGLKRSEDEIKVEIKNQVLDAYNNGAIYELMTPEFKAADEAAGEAEALLGEIFHDEDFFYNTQDELPDVVEVSEVALVEADKAFVKVLLMFDDDWGNRIDSTMLVMVRDNQVADSKNVRWLVDDVVSFYRGNSGEVNSYSQKAAMIEFVEDVSVIDDGDDPYEEEIEDESTLILEHVSYEDYYNPRFDFRVSYPSFFKRKYEAFNQDGCEFWFGNNYSMKAYGMNNVLEKTVKELFEDSKSSKDTYSTCKDNWFVVSGVNEQGNIYYRKTIIENDVEYVVELVYPQTKKAEYDAVVKKVIGSFQVMGSEEDGERYVVIDGSELRLRLGPSTSSETLKWGDGSNRHPEVGEKYRYLNESSDFYKIDYKGNEVWVSKQFTHIEMQ